MKKLKRLSVIASALLLALTLGFSVVACNCGGDPTPGPNPGEIPPGYEKVYIHDPETRPLTMTISEPDRVFNPFFSTSAYDSTVIGMTQIGMLSSDKAGKPVCGDDEPVVVKDYRTTENKKDGKVETTTYEFIIKNGIKFSDGTPLTINDVLFNLYVYLDPVYTGSATIYSTDIVGLNAYRTQNPDANDKTMESFEESFREDARIHRTGLIDYMKLFGSYTPGVGETKPTDRWTEEEKKEFQKNFVEAERLFREELISDWNSIDLVAYEKWNFTEPWQLFLMQDGGYMSELLKMDEAGEKYIKDEDGNFQYDPEKGAVYAEQLDEYLTNHEIDKSDEAAVKEATKLWAVNTVELAYFPSAVNDDLDYVPEAFSDANLPASIAITPARDFEIIITQWRTAQTLFDQFVSAAKTKHFETIGRKVPNISGINGKGTTTTDYHGNNLGEPHSVLSITINGVDPKAIWNFAFTVAPMHYYSGTWKGKNYVTSFDQEKNEFGVEYGNGDFMTEVVGGSDKSKIPVGAGVYMASRARGGAAQEADEFFNLNTIYYERNPYFYTLSGLDKNDEKAEIHNAKIKYFRYQVVPPDQIITNLTQKTFDIGDPNATDKNQETLKKAGISCKPVLTNGYGYIGINPKFVPNIDVRRAIMKAMDRDIIFNEYYKGSLAERIERPMSTTSWAYPDYAGTYRTRDGRILYDYDPLGTEIEKIVSEAGYEKVGGVYQKKIEGFGVDSLDYTFTIAGASQDHPAYNVFLNAVNLLNRHGFKVKLETSQKALSDLSAGNLAVWAAAWSSTIDPDMFQVYHKDSQATSVNNWGYNAIKANKTLYKTEWNLIDELSTLIDNGRNFTKDSQRAPIYAAALDVVMELAVEFPTYQRCDMTAYNGEVIDKNSLTPESELSSLNGLLSKMWKVDYTYNIVKIEEEPAA